MLAAGNAEGRVHLWCMADENMTPLHQGVQGYPLALAFDAQGERLAAISSQGQIRVWHLKNVPETPAIEPDSSVRAYTLDGHFVTPQYQEEVLCLWELAPTVTNMTLASTKTQWLSLAFRSDGYLLVAGYRSGQTRVWRLEHIPL